MSKITAEDVRKIALLSRLQLGEAEVEKFAGQLESILGYVDTLAEVNVDNIEPFISAAAGENVFRDDVPGQTLLREEALQNAPRQGDGFFQVPAVV